MKNIILIGFMGCGKSSVGKRLAQALNCAFLDTDEEIEKEQKRSISEIFATDGEAVCRDMETACLQGLLERKEEGFVLSVGGGLPIRECNRRLLKELGEVIFLRVSGDVVYRRIRNDNTRPLLQDRNPRGKIEDLMNARKGFYEDAANYVIDVDEKSFEEIIEEIRQVGRKDMQVSTMKI